VKRFVRNSSNSGGNSETISESSRAGRATTDGTAVGGDIAGAVGGTVAGGDFARAFEGTAVGN
jgi:hypothetical protein